MYGTENNVTLCVVFESIKFATSTNLGVPVLHARWL